MDWTGMLAVPAVLHRPVVLCHDHRVYDSLYLRVLLGAFALDRRRQDCRGALVCRHPWCENEGRRRGSHRRELQHHADPTAAVLRWLVVDHLLFDRFRQGGPLEDHIRDRHRSLCTSCGPHHQGSVPAWGDGWHTVLYLQVRDGQALGLERLGCSSLAVSLQPQPGFWNGDYDEQSHEGQGGRLHGRTHYQLRKHTVCRGCGFCCFCDPRKPCLPRERGGLYHCFQEWNGTGIHCYCLCHADFWSQCC
mmetsp:Transcript_3295/g.9185  ORF Transcript_3295/g.9185 Transcript_3295/m.9185 type:complete len:248 (-) Transcript_3295:3634-4377(-)